MLWDEFKDLAKEALEACGSYEKLNDEIDGWITENAAKRWYKEGCLAGVDMLDELIEAYHDLDLYSVIVSTGPDNYSYHKLDATRYRNGQFLEDLVYWAYQSWFMQQVWQIEKEKEEEATKEHTWDAIEGCVNDETPNIWTFFDMEGNEVRGDDLETKRHEGYLFLAYWKSFPLFEFCHRYEIWKIDWAFDSWVKTGVYTKEVQGAD